MEGQRGDTLMKDDMSYILQTPEECLLHAKIMAGRGRQDLAATDDHATRCDDNN